MATPAAILSMLVQVKGVTGATAELRGLDSTARRAGDGMDHAGKRTGKANAAFAAIGKAARVAGPLIGAAGLAAGVKAAVGEFEEAQKVGANTRQVIKSTGGAANVTAKQIENLAGSISKKSGIDDEQIQKGANLLLTFKNIRNETGKGRDIFNQATQAATDLSAAGFGSLESTSKQLGKALNDPIKGMTALGRSGVTFSEDQKKAIEALMETGKAADRVKAQQIVLREVQSQVGGQAAAQATATDKLKVALGNLAEAAGSVLVPMLEKAMTALTGLINQFIEGKGIATVIIPVFMLLKDAIGGLISVVQTVIGFLKEHQTVAMALGAFLATLALIYMASLVPAILASTGALVANAAAWVVLNAAMLLNPFVLVAVALAALVAAIVIAYRESETFREIVTTAWNAIKVATVTVWGFIKAYLLALWAVLKAVVTTYFEAYKFIITTAWNVIKTVTVAVWNAIKAALVAVWGVLRDAASAYWNAISTIITTIVRALRDTLAAIWTAIRTVAVTAWGLLRTAAVTAWTAIRDVIMTPIRAARDLISGVWHEIGTRAAAAWANIKSGVGQFATDVKDTLVDAFKGAANKVIDFVNTILDVIGKIPGVDLKGDIKHLAEGGQFKAEGLARGGAFRATGGFVNRPMTFMGEEAPRHPEYVIPTNPAYRSRAQGLLGQAANAIGFAQGGVYSQKEIEGLARKVGMPNPALMAAVAMAESGGDIDVVGPPSGRGLWQIEWNVWADTMRGRGLDNPNNPLQNALMAKYVLGQQGIDAWVAYTNGSYRRFLGQGVSTSIPGGGALGAVGGVMGHLLSEGAGYIIGKLPGVGDLPGWLHNTGDWALSQAKTWIKDKVGSVVSAFGGGGGGNTGGDIKKGDSLKDAVNAMNMINAKNYPYVYGGGHGSFSGPYDCSGLVSALLHAMGVLDSPITTDGLKNFGMPGPGKQVTIGVRGSTGRNAHTMIQLGNRFAESGSGHGAKWTGGWSGSFPIKRHPGGFAKGGIFGPYNDMHPKEGWGLAKGGQFSAPYVGAYANGGVVPRDGFGYLHAGETVVPGGAGGGGPLMHVDQMIVNQPIDFEAALNSLAFKLEMGG